MNIKPNRGRALRPAAHRFAAMLIEEVRAVTGMTFREITHALFVEGYPEDPSGKTADPDRAMEYTLPLTHRRSRVPRFSDLQALENDVAYLLNRPAHELVIEDRKAIDSEFDTFIATPKAGISWRRKNSRSPENLAVAYAWGWPTHGELVEADLADLFRWQYGYLWQRGHFTRAAHNFPDGGPIETLLENRVRRLTQTYYRLAGYMQMKSFGLPGMLDKPERLTQGIQISAEELQLFCHAWGPQGLCRWRHLGKAVIAQAQMLQNPERGLRQRLSLRSLPSVSSGCSAGILPEIGRKNRESPATNNNEIRRQLKQLPVI